MSDDKGRTGFQAAANLLQRWQTLIARDEVQGQQGRGCIERTLRRIADGAFMKAHACTVRPDSLLGQPEHVGRRIDAHE